MLQVKQAADELVGALQKGEAVLDQVAHKLEEEFAKRCRPGEVNPLVLAQRIRKLSSELPQLQQSCQSMIKAKQDLLDAAKQQLQANYLQLKHLRAAAGMTPDADGEQAYESFTTAIAEWDLQLKQCRTGDDTDQLSRDQLNATLAGLALGRR